MAENKPDAPLNPKIADLLAKATDLEADELAPPPYLRPQPDNFFWRAVDWIGRFAAPLGGVITVVVFIVIWIGGPDYAWVSFFFLLSLILFVIFIPAFLRKERREREKHYLQARAEQIRLKAEIAQMLLNQAERQQ